MMHTIYDVILQLSPLSRPEAVCHTYKHAQIHRHKLLQFISPRGLLPLSKPNNVLMC